MPYELLDTFPEIKKIISSCDYGLFEVGNRNIGQVKDTDIYAPPLDSVFSKTEYSLVDSFFTHSPFGSITPHNNDASLRQMLLVVIMLKGNKEKQQDMTFDDYIQFQMDSLHKTTYMLDERTEMAKSAAKENWRLLAKAIVYYIKNDIQVENIGLSYNVNEKIYKSSLLSYMYLKDEPINQTIKDATVERNHIWLPKIETMMKQGSCFIAVGLGHLQYKTGLIQLLRQRGYTLTSMVLERNGL